MFLLNSLEVSNMFFAPEILTVFCIYYPLSSTVGIQCYIYYTFSCNTYVLHVRIVPTYTYPSRRT